jgi:hypothetical protein
MHKVVATIAPKFGQGSLLETQIVKLLKTANFLLSWFRNF